MDQETRTAHQRVDHVLSDHTIDNPAVRTKVEKLRAAAKVLAHGIIDTVPDGIERDRAIMAVRDAVMLAVLGVEVNQPERDPRIRNAVIDEATAQAMRDGKIKI